MEPLYIMCLWVAVAAACVAGALISCCAGPKWFPVSVICAGAGLLSVGAAVANWLGT